MLTTPNSSAGRENQSLPAPRWCRPAMLMDCKAEGHPEGWLTLRDGTHPTELLPK